MLDRGTLVVQIAKALAGQNALDTALPVSDEQRRAEEVLRRVEMFLGADIEEAREILTRVLEDVS